MTGVVDHDGPLSPSRPPWFEPKQWTVPAVVVTQHGALPEGILPGKSGFPVSERDPEALAEQLADLIEHSERWPEIGRAGRAFVEARYDMRDLTQQLVELYRLAQGIFRHPQPTGIHAQQPA